MWTKGNNEISIDATERLINLFKYNFRLKSIFFYKYTEIFVSYLIFHLKSK